jgi:hypothetical protein
MVRGHEFSGDRRRWRGIVRLLKIGVDGEGLRVYWRPEKMLVRGCAFSGDRR